MAHHLLLLVNRPWTPILNRVARDGSFYPSGDRDSMKNYIVNWKTTGLGLGAVMMAVQWRLLYLRCSGLDLLRLTR